jgi:hypothetical protein
VRDRTVRIKSQGPKLQKTACFIEKIDGKKFLRHAESEGRSDPGTSVLA